MGTAQHPILSDPPAGRRARSAGLHLVALLSRPRNRCHTAAFSLVNAILRRAPIPHFEQIAEVYQKQTDSRSRRFPIPISSTTSARPRRRSLRFPSRCSRSPRATRAITSKRHRPVNGDYFRPSVRRDAARAAGRRLARFASRRRPSHDWQRAFAKDPAVVDVRCGCHDAPSCRVAPEPLHGNGQRHRARGVPAGPDDQPAAGRAGPAQAAIMAGSESATRPGVSMAQAHRGRAITAQWRDSIRPATARRSRSHDHCRQSLLDSVVVPAAAALMTSPDSFRRAPTSRASAAQARPAEGRPFARDRREPNGPHPAVSRRGASALGRRRRGGRSCRVALRGVERRPSRPDPDHDRRRPIGAAALAVAASAIAGLLLDCCPHFRRRARQSSRRSRTRTPTARASARSPLKRAVVGRSGLAHAAITALS